MENIIYIQKPRRYDEDKLQQACIQYLEMQYPGIRFHHSVNEGKKSILRAVRDKRMGMSAGFPDLLLFLPFQFIGSNKTPVLYQMLAVEFKVGKAQPSPAQRQWEQIFITTEGCNHYKVVRSLQEFIHMIAIRKANPPFHHQAAFEISPSGSTKNIPPKL